MTEIALFHHALGLTPGVVAFADTLRSAGHTVHTPDLFEGKTFSSIDDGVGYVREVGFDEIMSRASRAVEPLPRELSTSASPSGLSQIGRASCRSRGYSLVV